MRLAKVKLWLGFGQRQLQVPNGANYVIYGPEKGLGPPQMFLSTTQFN